MRHILLLLLLGCAAAAQALAAVRATLDAAQIASGDTVQLTLEHDGHTSGQPDLTPLQQDFDILGTSSSTMFELINGSASLKTEVVLTLAPKVTGHLTIPALSWDGEQSQPLSLTVTGPGGAGQPGTAGATAASSVFLESTATPTQPYVEAAVHVTVRLFTSQPLYRANLDLPANSNVLVKRLGPDEDSNAVRGGRSYHVVTRQYLLFPLRSGKLTLPGPVLDAEVAAGETRSPFGNSPFGGFFGGGLFSGMLRTIRPIRVHGNPLALTVRPRPAGALGSYWLPARNLTVTAAWSPAKLSARAGDPVTLDLDLQASGLSAAQLPDLVSLLRFPSGLKVYPDQPSLGDSAQNGNLIGNRDQTIALMADSPGHYTIPALTIRWWDTRDNQPRTATLPARTLTILPAPAAAPAAASSARAPAAQPRPVSTPSRRAATPAAAAARKTGAAGSASEWEWISIGLAVVWLATLGAWAWSRRPLRQARDPQPSPAAAGPRPPPPPDEAKESAAFRTACEANDARAARAHLLAWTAACWGAPPTGIGAIAARISDAALIDLLRDLDRACYAGGAWQGRPLAAALRELPQAPRRGARDRDGLAPLYP